jgi:thiamine-phosphate pyrophosphorylase
VGTSAGGNEQRALSDSFRARLRRRPPIVYAIVDLELVGLQEARELAIALLAAGVDALQLRGKAVAPRSLAELALAILPHSRPLAVPLLINDRVDVALAVGADGVHLGADDLPIEPARRLLGAAPILGATAHSLAEVDALDRRGGIDYLGFGAMFPTQTKASIQVQGPAALTAARAHTRLPLVAIGGIRPDRVGELAGSGLSGLAVASALSSLSTVPERLKAFRAALSGL